MTITPLPKPPPEPKPNPFYRLFPKDFNPPPFPTCTCTLTLQLYLCGCPDAGYNTATGLPNLTEFRCPVHFCPLPEQIWYRGAGFQHKDPYAPPQVGERYPVRVLPFPCYGHAQVTRNYVPPAELKRRRQDFLESRRDNEEAVMEVNRAILRSSKRRRGSFIGGDVGRTMKGRTAIFKPGARGKAAVKNENERRRYWLDRVEAAREDCDARWREEEREVDLEVLAGRRLSARFAWPGEDGYAYGAVEDNLTSLRDTWMQTWGDDKGKRLLARADMTDTGLVM
ncbi:hypothetical protein QBC34DRAFT_443004 [Podospora aff. communis PSN243]|uniref:Uncharacterized protein n=1 Tax=Podospora aff. communis PSN243 TaxID=3040156 RepID=A0AAV9G7V0_9PEZI|nr:hypothetical protein QBC34DRAFT_443004 [Podospora aff. communis PSN243]